MTFIDAYYQMILDYHHGKKEGRYPVEAAHSQLTIDVQSIRDNNHVRTARLKDGVIYVRFGA